MATFHLAHDRAQDQRGPGVREHPGPGQHLDGGTDVGEVTRLPLRWSGRIDDFRSTLQTWLDRFEPLIDALLLLRTLGAEDRAIDALLGVRQVTKLRASWELWLLLAESDGCDGWSLLSRTFGADWCASWQSALWGDFAPGVTRAAK